jgi:zinc/manganese transport system permease protein
MINLFSYHFVQLALLAALVLAGIHSYLGFHVVSRGVIFVDISMAQAAAFGAVVAMITGIAPHSVNAYFMSLAFTIAGAVLISISRTRDNRVPQEAFIGIIYAGFSAGAILLLARHPGGMEELEEMLTGSLLTMQWDDLISMAILYVAIGVFHYLLRNRFFRLSEDRSGAIRDGWSVGWWDFLFYASFGLVVTSSVHIAGVLLVFSFLVVPPVIALMFTRRKGVRLFIGWLIGFLGCLFGIIFSIGLNLPAGPSIIGSLILLLMLSVMGLFVLGFLKKPARLERQANLESQLIGQGK